MLAKNFGEREREKTSKEGRAGVEDSCIDYRKIKKIRSAMSRTD